MHDNVNIVSTEQKLLFDIRQLLIEQNELLQKLVSAESKEEAPQVGKHCVFCDGYHDNKGAALACAKKNKKNGGHA